MTFASFKSSGNMPVEKDPLTMVHNGSTAEDFQQINWDAKGPCSFTIFKRANNVHNLRCSNRGYKERRISVGMEIIKG